MNCFPFPDLAACADVLRADILYHRIPEGDQNALIEKAWRRGMDAAGLYIKETEGLDTLLDGFGLRIFRFDQDAVIGNQRCFAEIYPKNRRIHIYGPSVALWAQSHGMAYAEAEPLILSHELFHYLEYIGAVPASREIYTVPTLRIGSLVLCRSAVRAVSEIGAYAFSNAYYRSGLYPPKNERKE